MVDPSQQGPLDPGRTGKRGAQQNMDQILARGPIIDGSDDFIPFPWAQFPIGRHSSPQPPVEAHVCPADVGCAKVQPDEIVPEYGTTFTKTKTRTVPTPVVSSVLIHFHFKHCLTTA